MKNKSPLFMEIQVHVSFSICVNMMTTEMFEIYRWFLCKVRYAWINIWLSSMFLLTWSIIPKKRRIVVQLKDPGRLLIEQLSEIIHMMYWVFLRRQLKFIYLLTVSFKWPRRKKNVTKKLKSLAGIKIIPVAC